jgi:hypothetical protein
MLAARREKSDSFTGNKALKLLRFQAAQFLPRSAHAAVQSHQQQYPPQAGVLCLTLFQHYRYYLSIEVERLSLGCRRCRRAGTGMTTSGGRAGTPQQQRPAASSGCGRSSVRSLDCHSGHPVPPLACPQQHHLLVPPGSSACIPAARASSSSREPWWAVWKTVPARGLLVPQACVSVCARTASGTPWLRHASRPRSAHVRCRATAAGSSAGRRPVYGAGRWGDARAGHAWSPATGAEPSGQSARQARALARLALAARALVRLRSPARPCRLNVAQPAPSLIGICACIQGAGSLSSCPPLLVLEMPNTCRHTCHLFVDARISAAEDIGCVGGGLGVPLGGNLPFGDRQKQGRFTPVGPGRQAEASSSKRPARPRRTSRIDLASCPSRW